MNDPIALRHWGMKRYKQGDYQVAFECFSKVSELGLGDMEAHGHLSTLYRNGEGVEKDRGKEIYQAEEAAIGGHPGARHNLGYYEL